MKKRNGKIIFLLLYIAFAVLCVVGGFLLYRFVGWSGGCSITGNPYFSTVIGAVFGLLVGILILPSKAFSTDDKKNGDSDGNIP